MSTDAIIGDLMTETGRGNPYPLYAKLHEIGPASASAGNPNFFVVNGYREANAVLRNPGFGRWDEQPQPGTEWAGHASLTSLNHSLLDLNPPDHTRIRRLMSAVFTPRRTAALAPAIESSVQALLDAMADNGTADRPVDFMDEFAFRVPVAVICELLGVPEADRYRFRALAWDLGIALELIDDPAKLAPADEATVQLHEYFSALAAERRAEPRDDLTSALVQEADEADGSLSEEELLSNLTLLLLAGFETTTNLFGNGLALLFERPGLAAAVRAGTAPVTDFVEEVLRFDSPVQLTSRVARTEGLDVAGIPVPLGAEVLVLLGAANHDPARFRDPGVFDWTRPDNQPLSFGAGGHYCLGAALARLEATTAFPMLLRRFPALAPAEGVQRIRSDRLVLRGFRTLPVTVT